MKDVAPVIVFAYTRLESLQKTIEGLRSNYLAEETPLFVFVDKAQSPPAMKKNEKVKEYVRTIKGFKSVDVICRDKNYGLDNNVIDAVSQILRKYSCCICVEDDIITTANFLDYMNQALDFYQDNDRVMSIGAYGFAIRKPKFYEEDAYAYDRGCSWGWGTWKNRWEEVDWTMADVDKNLSDRKWRHKFNHSGSDMISHLKRCIHGGNMWDIRFHYYHFNKGCVTIYPFFSLAQNIGFGEGATHCKEPVSRFKVNVSSGTQRVFRFSDNVSLNQEIHKQVYSYNSLTKRVIYKFINKIVLLWRK